MTLTCKESLGSRISECRAHTAPPSLLLAIIARMEQMPKQTQLAHACNILPGMCHHLTWILLPDAGTGQACCWALGAP